MNPYPCRINNIQFLENCSISHKSHYVLFFISSVSDPKFGQGWKISIKNIYIWACILLQRQLRDLRDRWREIITLKIVCFSSVTNRQKWVKIRSEILRKAWGSLAFKIFQMGTPTKLNRLLSSIVHDTSEQSVLVLPFITVSPEW